MSDSSQKNKPSFDELISLAEASSQSGLSSGHLRLLVSSGVIWGKKVGRNWLTTIEAINRYLAEVHKRGPKPKSTRK